MTRRARTGVALASACVLAGALAACSAPRPTFEPAPGSARTGSAVDVGSVRVVYAEAGETIDFPDGAVLLGQVSAAADARVEGLIPEARKQAERRLARAAGEAGATLVIVRTNEVIEIAGGAAETGTPVFEDERHDRLSPAGYEPTRPVFRVRLTGDAVAEQ